MISSLPLLSATRPDLLAVASAPRSGGGLIIKVEWLLEYLLEAISQPLTLGGLLVLTSLLLLRLVLPSGA